MTSIVQGSENENWFKKYRAPIIFWVGLFLIVFGTYSYNHWYVPHRDLKEGFVIVTSFDCPDYHSIKAHLGSMIYHVPGDPYYARTSAANGYCFDSEEHAQAQGFRAPINQ
jgi:hypothetical protein